MSDHENPLADYPVFIELPVLWGHMDAFQHVNNVVYFRYFESARIAYGDKIEMYRYLQESSTGPILASTSCNFLKPLRYPDTILVGARTVKLTDSEMDQEYALYSRHQQRIAATAQAKVVAYDYALKKRTSFPPLLMERIRQVERKSKEEWKLDIN